MNNLWQGKYSLRADDFDKFNHIKPSAVLDLFQDAACQHAEELGLGFHSMLKRGYLWVLVRVKFNINEQPQRYQNITVKTWPLQPHRLNYRREYCITDENDAVLIKGSSDWMIIDSKDRKLISVPELYPLETFCNVLMFEEKSSKVRDFDTTISPYSVQTSFCDIDVNGHVNNTKYADFALNAICPKQTERIVEFQIDYRKEVLEGEKLDIYHLRDDNIVKAKGVNQNGDLMFACKITNI